MHRFIVLGTAFSLLFGATHVRAQDKPDDKPGERENPMFPSCREAKPPSEGDALAFYRVGKTRYDAKEYPDAIRLFLEAYAADCSKHELLLILAKAYELSNQRPNAAAALETYLARVPRDPEADARRLKIVQLRHEAATSTAVATQATPPTSPAKNPHATSDVNVVPTVSSADSHETTLERALPWAVTGLGVAMVATGVNLYLVGRSNVPAACNFSAGTCDPTSTAEMRDKAGSAHGLAVGGLVTGVLGLAAIGGGITWAITRASRERGDTSRPAATRQSTTHFNVAPTFGAPGGVVSAWRNF